MKFLKARAFSILLMAVAVAFVSVKGGRDQSLDRREPDPSALSRAAKKFEKETLRYDEPDQAEEYHRLKRSPDGRGPVPAERYVRAREHMERMPLHTTSAGGILTDRISPAGVEAMALDAWEQLGPGNIGGRTRALLINPIDPDIMYAAGVAGGVWKTTNGGASWSPLNDLLPNLAICSMAFDAANPDVIYAGTGEGYFNGDNVRGAGVFKTTNAGASWDHLDATATSDFHYVNDLVVSPNNSERVYAATRTGVWSSADGGATWARTLQPLNATGGVVQGGCLDLAVRTDLQTDQLFAACGTFSQSTVYRNMDAAGAGQWTPVLAESGMGRTSLAIAPSNQNVIYALASNIQTGNFNLGLQAVYRSTSNGDSGTWATQVTSADSTKLNTVLLSNPLAAFFRDCESAGSNQLVNQGWYDNCIAVDPVNAERVWVGGVDLFRSDDGGRSWGLASYWWTNPDDPNFAHADQHTIVFHPQYNGTTNRILYVGNDGGVCRTDDALAETATGNAAACAPSNTKVRWRSLNNSYGVTQFYFGLPYPDGMTYLGGTQDNGTLRGSDGAGVNDWEEVFGGDGGYVAIDRTEQDTFYVETTRLSIRRTTDGGSTFTGVTSGIAEASSNFLFINPFLMDAAIPQRLWTGGQFVWRTTDGGTSWSRASAAVAEGSVSALAIASTNANLMLVGTNRGHIHRTGVALSSGGGTSWPSVQPRTGFVSWVAFDPADANVAYATYSTFGSMHIWKSTDAGASWAGIDGAGETAIPDIPVHSIVVDPSNSLRLFAGTDLGVFVSLDGGASWARENAGFANVFTEALSLGAIGGTMNLYAFTHGRGVWRVPIGPAPPRIQSVSISGKKLLVFGQNFDSGSVILIDGAQQKTSNDGRSPATNLIGKKGGKKIAIGRTVSLRVRKSDGTLTPEFPFTRR